MQYFQTNYRQIIKNRHKLIYIIINIAKYAGKIAKKRVNFFYSTEYLIQDVLAGDLQDF